MAVMSGLAVKQILGDVDALGLGAVGLAFAGDHDLRIVESGHHAVHALIEGGNARHALQDAELVAVLELGLEEVAGDLAGVEVVGGGERGLRPSSSGSNCP